ncbi:MAG: glycosyltransferase [Planctomycetota bacterium]
MAELLYFYALSLFGVVLATFIVLGIGGRKILPLADLATPTLPEKDLQQEPLATERWPKVSVVVAARNEQQHIESSIESLLRMDYEPLEITVVNDRSEDRTGEILDELARRHRQLNVVHLRELPPGWLGKNHALQYGADHSSGEWLLFSDADIQFEPTVLRRAIHYVRRERIAHLSLMPETPMPSWLLESFVITFAVFLTIFTRPWNVRNMRSGAHIGVGAFNLVRMDAYQAVHGHQSIKMRPDDDLKLGKILKLGGFQPDVLSGVGLLSVPWYGSVREVFVGLEKNTFAVVEYRAWLTILSTLGILAGNVAPFVLMLVTSGATRWLFAAAAGLQWLLAAAVGFSMKARATAFLGYPLSALMFVLIQWRSMWLALSQGGIRWRGTLYSLQELRANRV